MKASARPASPAAAAASAARPSRSTSSAVEMAPAVTGAPASSIARSRCTSASAAAPIASASDAATMVGVELVRRLVGLVPVAARLGRVVRQHGRQHRVHPATRAGQQVRVERRGDDLVADAQRGSRDGAVVRALLVGGARARHGTAPRPARGGATSTKPWATASADACREVAVEAVAAAPRRRARARCGTPDLGVVGGGDRPQLGGRKRTVRDGEDAQDATALRGPPRRPAPRPSAPAARSARRPRARAGPPGPPRRSTGCRPSVRRPGGGRARTGPRPRGS